MTYWLPSDLWKFIAHLGDCHVQYKMTLLSRYFRDLVSPLRCKVITTREIRNPDLPLCSSSDWITRCDYKAIEDRLMRAPREYLTETYGVSILPPMKYEEGSYNDNKNQTRDQKWERFLNSYSNNYSNRNPIHFLVVTMGSDADIFVHNICSELLSYPLRDYFVRCHHFNKDITTTKDYYVLVIDISRLTDLSFPLREDMFKDTIQWRLSLVPQEAIKWYPDRNEIHIMIELKLRERF
jgi:hypothetical protein